MNSSSSGGKLERFFTGKGFYIVLFLCAAVIGVSAWMMAAGNGTMSEVQTQNSTVRTETMILPASVPETVPDYDALLPTAVEPTEELTETEVQTAETVEVMAEETEVVDPGFLWPVSGDVDRAYHVDQLRYDATLSDWRTHDGIDIAASVGSSVCASRAGRVESIVSDDLYGTVLTLDHGDGTKTLYASLAPQLNVGVDDQIPAGTVLGSVGGSAICESAQKPHLHFAMQVNGVSADPLAYLNA